MAFSPMKWGSGEFRLLSCYAPLLNHCLPAERCAPQGCRSPCSVLSPFFSADTSNDHISDPFDSALSSWPIPHRLPVKCFT